MIDRGFNETPPTSEISLMHAISFVDTYHTKLGDPRIPGKRAERCGDIAREVQRSAEKEGIALPMVESARLHGLFGGDPQSAFVHYINISDEEELGDLKGVIVDLTFCQFVDPETGEISQGNIGASGLISENPAAQGLVNNGFIPLTDQTLRGYLNATTTAQDRSYVENATVAGLAGQRLI